MTEQEREAFEFLTALWGDVPSQDGPYVLLWELAGEKSKWFFDLEKAASYANGRENVYLGVGLSPADFGTKQRCKAEQVSGIAGMWADIDIAGPAHKKTGLPPTETDAQKILDAMSFEPTLIVHSGHGIQPWWLFKEPWIFESDNERSKAAAFSKRWHDTLRAKAKKLGYDCDGTSDLARVLRIPGTVNQKPNVENVRVRLLKTNGPRYADLDDLSSILIEAANGFHAATAKPDVSLLSGDVPFQKFNALLLNDPKFAKSWKHERPDIDQSMSGYDMSLTLLAARVGWTDKELAALIVEHRQRFEPGGDKAARLDYIARTVARARKFADVRATEQEIVQVAVREESAGGTPNLGTVCDVLGGLPVKRVIRRGSAESGAAKTRYSLELENGGEISLGSDLYNQRQIRNTIEDCAVEKLGRFFSVAPVKEMVWQEIFVKAVKTVAQKIEMADEYPSRLLVGHIQDYLKDNVVFKDHNYASAYENGDPYIKDDRLHLHAPRIHEWLSRRGIRFEQSVQQLLSLIGFEAKRFTARGGDRVLCRYYWSASVITVIPEGGEGYYTKDVDNK